MSDSPTKRSPVRFKFSLLQILALTAIIAVGVAVSVAYQKNMSLTQQRERLLELSTRLTVDDPTKICHAEQLAFADDYKTWEVYVPPGRDYELRFGIGEISQAGIPEILYYIPLSSGNHRVTLHAADRLADEYRFVVFVDGKVAMERAMGSDWMPDGWRQASGVSFPYLPLSVQPRPVQLVGRIYIPKITYGNQSLNNVQSDDWVTSPGYRLWIDEKDRTYPPPGPFLGSGSYVWQNGIGLRDGLRYLQKSNTYHWPIIRPASLTREPVLNINPMFLNDDEVLLSDATKGFKRWVLYEDATLKTKLDWDSARGSITRNAYLHAELEDQEAIQPVVEMKWDAGRLNEVGIRLADVPANTSITRWRLRVMDGEKHLWRILSVGDQDIDTSEKSGDDQPTDRRSEQIKFESTAIDIGEPSSGDHRIHWRTDVAVPPSLLQQNRKTRKAYSGVSLYKGLPLKFAATIPDSLDPMLSITKMTHLNDANSTKFPGGQVINELQLELDATKHEWLWFRAEPK